MNSHDILGVSPKATKIEIRKAYHKLSMIHHPDVGGNTEQFIKIKEAYDNLMAFNPAKTHNIHYERRSGNGVITCAISIFSSKGNMQHTFLAKDIIMATLMVRNKVVYTWYLTNKFAIDIEIPKKLLVIAKYKYHINFISVNGTVHTFEQQIKDPRGWIEKLAYKLFN